MVEKIFGPLGGLLKLFRPIKTFFHIIYCFLVMYFFLILFCIPIILIICYRFLLSVIFSRFYKGKFKLVECMCGVFGVNHYANVLTLPFFLYLEGPCDIDALRERINRKFTTFKGKNGSRPYEKMLCSVREKFGFFVWENIRETFDINEHVRILPGFEDPNRIYTEEEVLIETARLEDEMWDEEKPRWEVFVIPKFQMNNGKVGSCVNLRVHHIYTDGVSAAQLTRLVLADQPAPEFAFDPVNPSGPKMSSFMKIFAYIQMFFLGPWASLRFNGNENHVFYQGPLVGNKFFGRTINSYPTSEIRKVRKRYSCSTSAIQHYALLSALRKTAENKGFSVPKDILGALIFAKLPYPNVYPQNHAIFGFEKFPMANGRHASMAERLALVNKVCSSTTSPFNYYILLTSRFFLGIQGLFPAAVIKRTLGALQCSYALSNVPGIRESIYVTGSKVSNVFGMGNLINGIRLFCGVTMLEDQFQFGFTVEKSSLIESREEFLDFIGKFENEMKTLMDSVYA